MARSGPSRLIVHAAGQRWRWAVADASGQLASSGACDPDQPDWPPGLAVHVLCDAGRCTPLSLDLPELSASRLQQALRWAAEEHLAGSAEEEHVVAGGRDDQGRLRCVVIAHADMEALMQPLAGEAVEQVCPDALCLPWSPGQVSLAGQDEQLLARWGEWAFGRLDAGLAVDLIEPAAGSEAEWRWYGGPVPSALADRVTVESEASSMSVLARELASAPVNLLTGPWTPSSTRTAGRHWRSAAALAGAVVVLAMAALALENRALEARSVELHETIEERFGEAFPGVRPAGRYRELAERELARLRFGQSAGLLELMYRVSPVLAGQSGISLRGLSYRDDRLELDIGAPDVAALDELEQRLRALALSASLQSASLADDGARGRIRIEGAAP
ncbi:MAG: type II secretion system protein GspL [Wenzhouxiangella sp.]